jgi:hypothetical protein
LEELGRGKAKTFSAWFDILIHSFSQPRCSSISLAKQAGKQIAVELKEIVDLLITVAVNLTQPDKFEIVTSGDRSLKSKLALLGRRMKVKMIMFPIRFVFLTDVLRTERNR